MKRRLVLPWPRSLIARMIVLSVVFLVLAVVWLVLARYMSSSAISPLESTRFSVRGEISRALDQDSPQEYMRESPVIAEIARANERFRYFIRTGEEEIGFGPPPRHLAMLPRLKTLVDESQTQAYWSADIDEGRTTAQVSFNLRGGKETFVEVSGIESPVDLRGINLERFLTDILWWVGRDPLITGGGVLLIALIVMLLAVRSLRTLTRAADAFDTRTGEQALLPEEGLPSEVASLVRAINEMIRRVETVHQEQEMFLATAAHELRTPMTVLRTRLEELPESDAKVVLREDVRRMATLVDQLLRLMQIRNSRDLPDRVDLVAVAREVVANRAPVSVNRHVDIELDSKPASLVVEGHRGLVEVAIANLVDNAISFSKPGDTLKVTVDDSGRITVSDHGPGVPPAELERIFEPFAKSPPNRLGHGLGLAIVRAVMTAHRGDVSVHNSEDGGADFALQFRNPMLPQPG